MSINAQPFQPQFKLIGNLAEDQVLVYDTSEGAFVNSTASGGGGASGYDAVANMGTGDALYFGDAGTTLQLKTIIGGNNITITDNGSGGLILAATNTDTIQDGTNLGTGTGIFDSKDGTTHALKFKSLAVGAGLTLTDDGAGTLTLVNTIAAGTTDADLTLSNLSNVATARTNLEVYSKTEGDARYHDKFSNFLPSQNNIYDIGSPTLKFNDIYAETFQGTAVLADQLTISGTSGQVLTHNGTNWVAGAGSSVLSSASDMSNVAPADGQHLVWESTTGLWTPSSHNAGGGGYQDSDARGAISVSGDLSYNNTTGVISFTQNDAWSNITGTPTTLAGYGITDGGGSVTPSSTDTFTNKSGAISQWTNDANYLTSVPAQTFGSLTGKPTTIAGYGITDAFDASSAFPYGNLTGTPTIPTAVSQLTNDSSFLSSVPAQSFASLTGKPTTLAGYGITDGGGSYANSNVDAHLNVSGATANQVLKWTGTDYDWVTSTDSDTTYTAGSGLTLTGTVFSLTSGHFDGAYGSLTGAPTIPSGNQIIDWTSASAGTIHASNYTDTNTTYTAGSGLTLSGTEFSLTGGHYNDSAVDTHLNVSGATANQVLKWTGTDYDWVTSTDSDTTYTAGSGLTLTGTVFSLTGGTVTASSSTAFTNKTGNISQWTNDAGYLTSETDSQTLSLSGTTLAISTGNNVDLGALTIDDFADVNITSVSDGQFLTYNNGSGEWTNSTVSIPTLTSQLTNDAGFITSASTYDNSDVDTHLNQSNPTSGYVLSWNGSDYAWVSNGASGAHYTDSDARAAFSATTGLSYNSGTGVFSLNSQLENLSDVSSTTPNTGEVLKWNGSTWTPSADVDTDTVYTTFNSDFDTRLAAKSTTNLSEGSNKYFTDTRARQAISASGDLSYNASTGVISYTAPSSYANSNVDTHLNRASATTGQILSWNGSDYDWIANAGTPAWSSITGKPTTIAGFGITDAFDGIFSSLAGKPTTIAGYGITDAVTPTSANVFTNKQGNISQWTNDTGYLTSVPAQTFGSLTGKPTTLGGYGITDGYVNSDVDSHLNRSSASTGDVLSWNGSDFSWVAQSGGGGGATDKIEEGNSSVEVIDGGANGHVMFNTNGSDRWQVSNSGHILPEADATYDIGSASNKVRHLFLSNSSLYLGTDTLRTNSSNLLFNGDDVQDYSNLKNKPDTSSAGTGIQINSGVISLNSALSGLSDVHTTAPTDGQVLKWDNSNSRWEPGAAGGTLAMNNLTDVDTSGISTGQYLKWDGSNFVASTVSGGGASAINDLSDVDTNTSAPSNGDVLTWSASGSEWAPQAPSGGGGSGATIEYFKLNYATNGNLDSVTNTTSGVSATITSATGGTVDITFSSTNYPPANMLMYGYAYASNKYVVKPVSGDMTTKEVTGGGSSGSPIAFGSMGSVKLTLKLREADTGASRSFGTTTHAWLMFTTV